MRARRRDGVARRRGFTALLLYHRAPLTKPQNRAAGRRDVPRVTHRKTNLP